MPGPGTVNRRRAPPRWAKRPVDFARALDVSLQSPRAHAVMSPQSAIRPGTALLAALTSVGLLYVTGLGLFHVQFQTNDDPAMAMMAAGFGLTDSGTQHLLNTHV